MASIAQQVLALKPIPIDPTKCTPNKSLYQQILNNSQATSERQAKQFNLGNTHITSNPVDAADFILEREYGDSSLFVQNKHTSVFIPPTFVSNQYKKSSTAILDYDVEKDIYRLLVNLRQHSPTYWLTKELETFMQTQNGNDSIDSKVFDRWILNVQIMYLIIVEMKTDQLTLPTTTSDLGLFIQGCISVLPDSSPFRCDLQKNLTKTKNLKKVIKQMIIYTPNQDSNLEWLLGLQLSEIGEKVEYWMYDQLLPLKDDILQETVVLSSLTFLTNAQKKMHKENDNLSINNLHYITMETEIKPWLTSIFKRFPTIPATTTSNPLDEVKDILKILVFAIHVSKKDQVAPITNSTWVEYTSNAIENVSTSHNILFYSNQQMAILNNNDPRYKKVIIRGPFGVGKSILLAQKAIQLNEQSEYNGKVMFIVGEKVFTKGLKSMLHNRLKVELEENRGIFVEQFETYETILFNRRLLKKINTLGIKAVFFDECQLADLFYNEWLKKMKMASVNYIWIAPSTDSLKDRTNYNELSSKFSFVNLKHNFRNTRQIIESTKTAAKIADYSYKKGIVMSPRNFPGGCEPVFVDDFIEAVKQARKRTNEGILVILTSAQDIKKYSGEKLNENGKAYHHAKNDFKEGENPFKFLQDGNVLFIDEKTSFGFEWATVIEFEGDILFKSSPTYHDCNYMLRCTTNLIVVKESS
eukprot:TCONS_00031760-protein